MLYIGLISKAFTNVLLMWLFVCAILVTVMETDFEFQPVLNKE